MKRTTGKHIIVDITDKETGESIGQEKEKLVFRVVPKKEGKLRLQIVVDIDPDSWVISKVVETKAVYDL
ncbi:hypothetical protein [Sporosarcina sp. D27]|uniref:hypothetical protein n=1 Tax=Sporosarcina sp. D27 TaxID=1382305 RepID=UPI000470E8AD|nr:hypothetical protein [Sporosarcina sp. D27]